MKIFTEGVFTSLLKLFGGGKVRRELRKLEKLGIDDPSFQTDLDNLAASNAELEKTMKSFCSRHPEHPLCTGDRSGSKVTSVKY